ncbi:PorV/PorQ family protein [Candidatus Latescibacterota bacterium]
MKRSMRTVRLMCLYFVIHCICIMTSPAHARNINDALGKTSFTWLKAIPDATITASGECLSARDGLTGILIHPAALAGVTKGTGKLSYVSHYVDTQYGSVGYAGEYKERFLGVRFTYVNYGEFIRTGKTGERLGTFTAGDMGISINIGRQVRNDLKIGAMVSYLNSRIDDFTARAALVDLGVLYYPPFNGLTVGAVLRNLGKVTKSYTSGYSETLPVTFSFGVRKKLEHSPFTLYADVIFPNDDDIAYAFGLEASVKDILFLYAGTKSMSEIDFESRKMETDYAGITTFGIGLTLDRYRFNYAYCPDDVLDDIHKITLCLTVP